MPPQSVPETAAGPTPTAKPQTIKPVIGGILILITGVMGLITAIIIFGAAFITNSFFSDFASMFGEVEADAIGWASDIVKIVLIVAGVIGLIFAIIAMVGGIFALKRRRFAMAVVGSVFALIVGAFTPFFYYAGVVLAVVGLVLVAISHNEFE